jgi:signal transduction histidine kinase
VSVGPDGVVQALQDEREFAELTIFAAAHNPPAALVGLSPSAGGLNSTSAEIIAETSGLVSEFESTVDHAGTQAEQIYSSAFVSLAALPTARHYWAKAAREAAAGTSDITNYKALAVDTYQSYTTIIDSLVDATAEVPLQISDTTLRTGVEALYTSFEKTEADWQVVQDLMVASWETGAAQSAEAAIANEDWGADLSWGQRLSLLGTGPYQVAVTNMSQDPVDSSLQLDIGLIQTGSIPPLTGVLDGFTEPAGNTPSTMNVTPAELGEREIAAVVNSRGDTLHNNAVLSAIEFGLLGALGTLLGFLLIALVSRSVSKPLIDLARQADKLASETLPSTVKAILDAASSGAEMPPAPKVSVNSRDEVAEMARALDAVNKTAVELATGQAALRRNLADAFVNLGRRNQNLVTRQLEYISEIELKEADPESLEELFRLDHLATRMRRNAESLLILAGSGPARQWSAAVPAMDVARAASAEVEDYKRLRLHHFDPAMMTGSVTTDLVHIMAELVENALTFSPPGSPVDVYGRFLEGGYVIVIVDSGIGMSVEDLELANHRLEGEGEGSEVPGRYLGHFVAGRLAARHGIAISLQASHSGGLVARVKIPASLIEEPVPDLSAVAEVRSAPLAPVYQPAPLEEPAAPIFQAPPPVFEAPAPTYEPPAPAHQPPTAFYEPPAPVHQEPAQDAPTASENGTSGTAFPYPTARAAGSSSEGPDDFEALFAAVFPPREQEAEDTAGEPANNGNFYHSAVEHGTVEHGTVEHGTVEHRPFDHSPVEHSTADGRPVADFAIDDVVVDHLSTNGAATKEVAAEGPTVESYGQGGSLPDWAGKITEPSWDAAEPDPEENPDHAAGTPDWAAPTASESPDLAETAGFTGSAPQPSEPPRAVPDADTDEGWDPVLFQKPASNPFGETPSAPAPTVGAVPTELVPPVAAPPVAPPTIPAWASSITATAPFSSHDAEPATQRWDAPAPNAPAANAPAPNALVSRAPDATPPESITPRAPDLGSASPLITGHTVDARLSPPPAQPSAAPAVAAPATAIPPLPAFQPTTAVAPATGFAPPAGITPTARITPTAETTPAPAPSEPPRPASWDTLPPRPQSAPPTSAPVGPAEQARNTSEGLRKLTRRVPGASLPQEDGSLRRDTPTSTSRNPLGLTGALSQYLSATANESRPEKEHNAR